MWGNSSSNPIINGASARYSDVQGGHPQVPATSSRDPRFVRSPTPGPDSTWGTADDDYGDLRLQMTSPCIDVGDTPPCRSGVTTTSPAGLGFYDFPAFHDPRDRGHGCLRAGPHLGLLHLRQPDR
jgi:hypothetical protein